MVLCALFAGLIAVCAWLSIPLPPVSFTLQTFGVLLSLGILGGRRGLAAIGVYLLLGVVGLPVFSGFRGGIGALLDSSGGFLWGFFLGGLAYRLTEGLGRLPAMVAALIICYSCGCLWFCYYANTDFLSAWKLCCLPFLLPEMGKLLLAYRLSKRLERIAWAPS